MDLDAVVGVLVGILRVHTLGQRREAVGKLAKLLEFLLLLGSEFALTLDVLEALVDVNVAGCLVEQCATGVELGLHDGKHVVNGGEVDDFLAELTAILGVCQTFFVGGGRDADRLSGNAEAGTVHQCHDVLDEAQFAATAKFSVCILIHQLTGWRTVDAEFVFDAANVDATLALVVDEHRKTAAVLGAFLRTCQHEVDIGVTIGDEALAAIEQPAVVLLAPGCLEHDALQVGAGIWLSKVHRHGFAGADAWNKTLALVFVTELIKGLDAVLQRPDVFEAGIGRGNHLVDDGVGSAGEVETSVAAGHGDTT